jgi:hypothetical protein
MGFATYIQTPNHLNAMAFAASHSSPTTTITDDNNGY